MRNGNRGHYGKAHQRNAQSRGALMRNALIDGLALVVLILAAVAWTVGVSASHDASIDRAHAAMRQK